MLFFLYSLRKEWVIFLSQSIYNIIPGTCETLPPSPWELLPYRWGGRSSQRYVRHWWGWIEIVGMVTHGGAIQQKGVAASILLKVKQSKNITKCSVFILGNKICSFWFISDTSSSAFRMKCLCTHIICLVFFYFQVASYLSFTTFFNTKINLL